MSKKTILMQSAKFRKDYMAMIAFLLFFVIVIGECALAIALPWHTRLDKIWVKQVSQLELVSYFDALRRSARNCASQTQKPLSDELLLLCGGLDRMASYLHRYSNSLEPDECQVLMDEFHAVGKHIYALGTKTAKAFSSEISLNTQKYIEKIRGNAASASASPQK